MTRRCMVHRTNSPGHLAAWLAFDETQSTRSPRTPDRMEAHATHACGAAMGIGTGNKKPGG